MGQKVNPNGFRFGIFRQNLVRWYADRPDYGKLLVEDQRVYRYFDKLVRRYQIGRIELERFPKNKLVVTLHLAKIGSFRGQDGEGIKRHHKSLQLLLKRRDLDIRINLVELQKPELNARLVAEAIAEKLENRTPFRLAQRQLIRACMRAGAKGIKTQVSGRLGGVDMARTEGYTEGEMRLHTLRQKVDYATALGRTTYGVLGVKVWISFGEILRTKREFKATSNLKTTPNKLQQTNPTDEKENTPQNPSLRAEED